MCESLVAEPQDRPAGDDRSRRCWARWWRSRWPATGSAAGSSTNLLIFMPMATPEVVMGSSLLTLFVEPRGHPARLLDDPDRPHHVLHQLRRRHGQGPHRRPRPAAGAGGDGPLRQRVADVLAGHVPAGRSGHRRWRAARVLAVVRRLHHHELQRGLDRHVPDVRVGCRPARRPRHRSTCRHDHVPASLSCWWPSASSSRSRASAGEPGPSRRRPRRSSRRWPTPSRCRSGWPTRPPRRPRRPWSGPRRPTWPSSAAATPASGPPCWPRRRDPARDVVVLEGREVGWAASGRNGGFCAARLTHGLRQRR